MRIRQVICSLLLLATPAGAICAQNPKPSSGGADKPSMAAADGSSSNLGFSIESEMLTYRAVEADSEAIGCDVGKYLYEEDDGPCPFTPHRGPTSGVVLVSSSGTTLGDFQLWRQDMARMKAIEARAAMYCPARRGLATPEQAISLVQSTMALFARTETVSSVQGTVKDQALLDAVARELRAVNLPVLTPELYYPFDLGPTDLGESPYFRSFELLSEKRRDCEESQTHAGGETEEIGSILQQIDTFVTGLTGQASTEKTTQPQKALSVPASTNDGSGQISGQIGGQGTSSTSSSSSDKNDNLTTAPDQATRAAATAHFASVFRADGLAKALGYQANGDGPSPKWQHVLWLKALESGGTVSNEGMNILGSKVRFSGGAVATYALFSLDGTLDCAANVYSYGGRLRPKAFLESFSNEGPEAKSKAVLLPHNACRHTR